VTGAVAIAPILAALLAGVSTLAVRRWPRVQQAVSVAGAIAYVAAVGTLVWLVVFGPDPAGSGAVAYQLGGWTAPFGITLVADALAAFMLALTAAVALYATVFSVLFINQQNQRAYYHPLYYFLLLGATGAFLTGDLFNLFVWFEVMLMASYVFVAFYGNDTHTAAAMRYLVLNIVGSVVMLLAVGGLYATLGTLNMADMAAQLSDPGARTNVTPVVGLSSLLLVTFALKAGLVPFQFWVPAAYRAAPLPVVATFAGATKKVGIYAIIRLYFTVFDGAAVTADVPFIPVETAPLAFLAPVLLVMGFASIFVGGLGAVNHSSLEGLLAYSSIAQIGFIAVPVALAATTTSASLRHLGVLAALVYALHHALAKGLLFLSAGVIRDGVGTTRLPELGGLAQTSPTFAGVFLVGGLSLVGIPPLAGFFGKLFVFDAAATRFAETPTAGSGAILVLLLLGAVLTILYVTHAWIGSFWGSQPEPRASGALDSAQIAVLVTMAVLVVAVGVGFEPVYVFADAAAEAALDQEGYVDLVDLGGGES